MADSKVDERGSSFASLTLAAKPRGLPSNAPRRTTKPQHHRAPGHQHAPIPPRAANADADGAGGILATSTQAPAAKAPQAAPPPETQQSSIWGSIISRFTGGSRSVTNAASSSLQSTPSRMFPSLLPSRGASGMRGPGAAAARKPAVVWFRGDLRLHDHEPLVQANRDGTSVLPLYCFDLREYGKNAQGFDRSGPYRARFILDALAEIRAQLREAGSELVVRVGRPEEVVPQVAREVGAGVVYCHGEVAYEELQVERAVRAALQQGGVELRGFWGGTLFHPDDMPFSLQQLPGSYAEFKRGLGRAAVRPPLERPERLKGLPAGGVDAGELPSMLDLGFDKETLEACERDRSAVAGLKGGEAEAFAQLQAFVLELTSRASSGATSGPAGRPSTSFSCRVSPWLAHGCLSPRQLFEQVRRHFHEAAAAGQAVTGGGGPGRPADWLMYELMWRDFFKMITRKYSLALAAPGGRQQGGARGGERACVQGQAGIVEAGGMAPALAAV